MNLFETTFMQTIIILLVSMITTFFLVPIMIKVAHKTNILDYPDERKSHDNATPLLGGVAIFIGTIISILLFARSTDFIFLIYLCVGIFGVMAMGLIDDIFNLSAKLRLLILLGMATLVVIGCTEVLYNGIMSYVHSKDLYFVFIIFMIIWTVGITNAINWSDGLDGLATTQSLISTISFAIIFLLQGRTLLVYPVAVALVGSLIGFFPYNICPAKLFMGDAGSMFIGFILGVLSISSVMNNMSVFAIIIPIYILLVPIADMGIAIIRRIANRRPIMQADNRHLHHILKMRYSTKTVVLIMGIVQIIFAAFGIIIFIYEIYNIAWIIFSIGFIIALLATLITANINGETA